MGDLENALPNREELFVLGAANHCGSLQIITGLLHVSCGGVLAAAVNFMEFSTAELVATDQRSAFFIAGAASLMGAANCIITGMKVSIGLNPDSSLWDGLRVYAFWSSSLPAVGVPRWPRKSLGPAVRKLGIPFLSTSQASMSPPAAPRYT